MPQPSDNDEAGDGQREGGAAPSSFRLIAHRGLSALAPENTLEAFDLALARGFEHFETDVQLTTDGEAIVLHDETAAPGGRTLTLALSAAPAAEQQAPSCSSRPVAECTLAELREMDAAAWFWRAGGGPGAMLPPDAPPEAVAAVCGGPPTTPTPTPTPPPTLDEVLLRYRGRAHIHLELKSKQPGLPRAVLDALERTGWRADLERHAAAEEGEEASPSPSSGCGAAPGLTLTSFHLGQLLRVAEELDGGDDDGAAAARGGGGGGGGDRPGAPQPPTTPKRCWLRRHWLVQELDAPTLAAIAAVPHGGLTGVCPRANAATREGVEAARRALMAAAEAEGGDRGRRPRRPEVRAWGVRSLALLRRAVEVGADGATVNWPHLARDELEGGRL